MHITVLTASRNPGDFLDACLGSVAGQSVQPGVRVDHLVIDGASSDGTPELLRKWSEAAPGRRFRSEQDGGFYEALNWGIEESEGEVVGVLNSDDFYFDHRVLRRVADLFVNPSVMAAYGDLVYVKTDRRSGDLSVTRYWKAGFGRRESFSRGWMPPHPTMFVRRCVFEEFGGFRTDFGTAADYEWMIRTLVKGGVPFRYLPGVQVVMREGGMSNRSLRARVSANGNDRRAWTVNELTPKRFALMMKPLRKIPQWLMPGLGPVPRIWFPPVLRKG